MFKDATRALEDRDGGKEEEEMDRKKERKREGRKEGLLSISSR